ncbi:MAG: hypothetical protein J7K75_12145 [Desulfuromonas sp.]|nr:hypothetical protein [Desulfuromonas sp.]
MRGAIVKNFCVALLAVACMFGATSAEAFSLYNKGGFASSLDLEMGLGVFSSDNAGFGAGGWGADQSASVGWYEMYAKPVLNASYTNETFGTIYGGLSMVASSTYGDGDIAGFTSDNSDGWESEQAYLGFKTGLLSGMGIDNLDISAGEQEFTIGDGFLVADAEFDSAYGCYWMAPRKSFRKTAIVKADMGAVHTDLFYLMSDLDYGDTELYGVNVEYVSEKLGTVGASYMTVDDAKEGHFYQNRKGMDIYSVRGQGSVGVENLFLAAEYVQQTEGDRQDVDANAYYAEVAYTFAQCPWTPTLTYKYAFFSGDEDGALSVADGGDGDYENFDPMFYGFLRGWGNHFMGEIVGEYYLFNSNQKTHMVKLDVAPFEGLNVGAIYYDFSLDEENLFGQDLSDDHFAQEVNIYADYAVTDNLWVSAVFAWATPKKAGEEYTGGEQDMKLVEIGAFLYF